MRIEVVGGGPAGLYFALLAKKEDRSREIVVHERNAPDATFGWGVVFSEEALGSFRDADIETWAEITDTFARWNAIDIHYGGELVRSRGHAFSAIARKQLLGILQGRCRDLGVRLVFHGEVPDLDDLLDADLVVGADGVNSTVRRLLGDRVRPNERIHRTKYVWFGSDLLLQAFTFVFRETEHGIFQAHAYPFDADLSTFIVECREDAWRGAGLERASEEESIAFCQDLFAPELAGHKLLSNRSLWTNFVTLRCESWHDGNFVLLGDAAHTAHFTIGSGTKLAMEDSIALVGALQRHPRDLETALTHYEMERQPVVERLQQAALESAAYFENVRRYASMEPVQFAVNLLTRSGRISYANLTQRDPDLVRRADAAFASRAGKVSGLVLSPPPAFVPIAFGDVRLPNRLPASPPSLDDAADGMPLPALEERLKAAGRQGAGLVLSEFVAVSADGRITRGTPGLYEDGHAEAWSAVATAVHGSGAAFGLVMGHAGRRGSTRPRGRGTDRPLRRGGWPLIAASPIPYGPGSPAPREMTPDDMDLVIRAFAGAAAAADRAGTDLLEVDAARGYLLAGFLSPLANRREDEYGGSFERRLRFPLEVVDAVRASWAEDRSLCVRLSATDWVAGGLEVDEAVEIARAMKEHGTDLIHVDAGGTTPRANPDYRPGFLLPFADLIRNGAAIPVLVGGFIQTLDQANTALAAGRADLVLLELPQAPSS
jgi:anthraniloyl-CoA monooxygenase